MTEKFVALTHCLNTFCSIGISLFPDNGAECETLIKYADQDRILDAGRERLPTLRDIADRPLVNYRGDEHRMPQREHIRIEGRPGVAYVD